VHQSSKGKSVHMDVDAQVRSCIIASACCVASHAHSPYSIRHASGSHLHSEVASRLLHLNGQGPNKICPPCFYTFISGFLKWVLKISVVCHLQLQARNNRPIMLVHW
jgi:hypothetical protein